MCQGRKLRFIFEFYAATWDWADGEKCCCRARVRSGMVALAGRNHSSPPLQHCYAAGCCIEERRAAHSLLARICSWNLVNEGTPI